MHRPSALWFLGYADQAVRSMEQALTLARQLAHLPSLACVFFLLPTSISTVERVMFPIC